MLGCESGPKTNSVKGKVVVKGSSQAPAGGTVVFQSVANPEAGTIEGEHRILIQPPEQERGQPKLFDDKYRSYDTSGLTKTITAGENNITIEVEPPRARR
jgi:hypothetical protein